MKFLFQATQKKILDVAKKNNIKMIKRPKFLCTSKSNEFKSWKHAVHSLKKEKNFFRLFFIFTDNITFKKKK